MSQTADLARGARKIWAARGSSHDRLIRVLQLAMPAAVGALLAVLVFAPFGKRGEISFLLAKDTIDLAGQRLRVERARYAGVDSQGRSFVLSAADAVQRSASDPVVRLRGLSAAITMADGPATLRADTGSYDPIHDSVGTSGPVHFATADGYRIDTADVQIDLKQRTMSSLQPVSGTLPIGRFSANRLNADLQTRIVRLHGSARLHVNQGAVR